MIRPQHTEQVEPFVDDSCKLLLHMNGQSGTSQFIDSSNNPKVVTAYGNAMLSNSHYRFGGTSAYFDGSGDYLTVPNSVDVQFGNSDWSFISYFYITSYKDVEAQYGNCIMGSSSQDNTKGFILMVASTTLGSYPHKLVFVLRTPTSVVVGGVTDVSLNSWNCVYGVRKDGTTNIYLNGNLEITTTSYEINSTDGLSIGRAYPAYTTNFDIIGYIDEISIHKRAIPIGELYPQKRPYGYPIGGT